MKLLCVLLFCLVTVIYADDTSEVSANESYEDSPTYTDQVCSTGTKVADNCVSIKFPWKSDVVYFCPDEDYTYTLEEKLDESQCSDALSEDYMSVDGPWMNCPEILETDRCAWYNSYDLCYDAPYNRECQDISDSNSCCPDYYCGIGESWDDCKDYECQEPSSDVAYTKFYDYYSCCPYYQLVEDEKPGSCPEEIDYYGWTDGYEYTEDDWFYSYNYSKKRSVNARNKRGLYDDCVGDFNCPEAQKCCSTYGDYGYCTDPTFETETNEVDGSDTPSENAESETTESGQTVDAESASTEASSSD